MQRNSRILIVGHQDSLENSLWSYFTSREFTHVHTNSRLPLDVLSWQKVDRFFKDARPEYVFLGSVRSGGIAVNQKFPADFIDENLQAQLNIVRASAKHGVTKLVYLAASCIYPKNARQPIKESSLMQGCMESTSEAYSTAKLAGIKLCQAYRQQYGLDAISIVPATLYGPGSDTDIETAHVMGALMAKFHQAVREGRGQVDVWGTGKPRREFLYTDDFVSGVLFLMRHHQSDELINLGTGSDVTIRALAGHIAKVSGFKGKIVFDASKPDGAMRKLLDSRRVNQMGWRHKVTLEEGVRRTYKALFN